MSVGHWNLANAKLSSKKTKKFTQFFQKLRVWAAPIKIFRYNNLSDANSHAVCVLKLSLLKQATAIINRNAKNIVNALRWLWKMKCIFFCCSRKDFRLFVQAAKQQAVWLSLNCINGKYLRALPTPTTFEKVNQTFIIAW